MNLPYHYILDENGNPRPTENLEEWAEMFLQPENREIARDRLVINGTEVLVSTIFLAVDHGFGYSTKPVLYETMIFGGHYDQEQWRYHDRSEALEGHQKALKLVGRSSQIDKIKNFFLQLKLAINKERQGIEE